MHPSTILTSLGLLTAASALLHPFNQPSGAYIVTVDEAGNDIHTLVANASAAAILPSRFRPRSTSWPSGTTIQCPQDYLWSTNFYQSDGAWQQMFDFIYGIDGRPQGWKSYYVVNGQALAYLCSYHEPTNVWRVTEWVDFVNWSQGTCTQGTDGWLQAAWIDFHGAWKKSYGYTHPANKFC